MRNFELQKLFLFAINLNNCQYIWFAQLEWCSTWYEWHGNLLLGWLVSALI